MTGRLTRRQLIARGAAAGAVFALPAQAFSASPTLPVFRLETGCGAGACACNACRIHDANSLFPTRKAADGNRAHTFCDCVITEGTLHMGAYIALFGEPDTLLSYRADLRELRVRALLKNHPPSF